MHKNYVCLFVFFNLITCISVTQKELSALRLGHQQLSDSLESSGHQVGDGFFFPVYRTRFGCLFSLSFLFSSPVIQCVLRQLVVEYNQLNDALRTEKKLYQNLVQIQNQTDG